MSCRYGRGLVEFPELDTDDELLEIIFVEDQDGDNNEFKPSLTPDELKRSLEEEVYSFGSTLFCSLILTKYRIAETNKTH